MNLLTVSEVAAELRLSKGTVYAMCSTGKMPSVRIGMNRGSVRVPRQALEKWLREELQDEASTPEEMFHELAQELTNYGHEQPPDPPTRSLVPAKGCCQDLAEIEVHGNWALWCERHNRAFNPHFIDTDWLGRTPRTGPVDDDDDAVQPDALHSPIATAAGN